MHKEESIFPLTYFGPISYYVFLLQEDIWRFNLSENYQKQTYRNRCEILGANGKLKLVVPIQHLGKRKLTDIKISYAEEWRKIHLKSLQSAYQRSPFFEFYEDSFIHFYTIKHTYLIDLCMASIELIRKLLKTDAIVSTVNNPLSLVYNKELNDIFHPKQKIKLPLEPYMQVFAEKINFENNLSILDLIFNKGFDTKNYLLTQNIKITTYES